LFAIGSISASIVSLLSFAASPARAQESVMILAMVRCDQPPAQRIAPTRPTLSLSTPEPATVFSLENDKGHALRLDMAEEANLPSSQYLTKQEPDWRSPLVLVHTSLREYGRPKVWMNIQAGFGQIWEGKSAIYYEISGAAWQEPNCAYIKAVFNF
jgi:hypothetical protein